jgi:hypothetical protein
MVFVSRVRAKEMEWFQDRIGSTILRNGSPFKIENIKYAEHLFATQHGYEFKDV